MVSSKDSSVIIQTSSQSLPSTPSWFGEVAVIAHYLEHLGVLSDISERVRFARRRFGRYDLIDFAVVLLGYAISGERTLEEFYERVLPFAHTFMALFGRECLPPSPLDAQSLSRGPGSSSYRSITYVVSRRSLGSPTGPRVAQRAAEK